MKFGELVKRAHLPIVDVHVARLSPRFDRTPVARGHGWWIQLADTLLTRSLDLVEWENGGPSQEKIARSR
jgi:hypothetical protein